MACGLPYPTRKGQLGGVSRSRAFILKFSFLFLLFVPFLLLTINFFCLPDGFANRHATKPNFNLVNKESLDKILQAEVFINKDGQLRAAHLILGYTLISSSFQVPKCVIKAKDPRLHRISIAVHGFLLPEGDLVPKGTFTTQPIPKGVPRVAFPLQYTSGKATSSQPIPKGEEEK